MKAKPYGELSVEGGPRRSHRFTDGPTALADSTRRCQIQANRWGIAQDKMTNPRRAPSAEAAQDKTTKPHEEPSEVKEHPHLRRRAKQDKKIKPHREQLGVGEPPREGSKASCRPAMARTGTRRRATLQGCAGQSRRRRLQTLAREHDHRDGEPARRQSREKETPALITNLN